MTDLHEASFVWPDTNPQDVILTGSFDQWSASMHLSKSMKGFVGKVKVPWGARVQYKFIVDGKWMTLWTQPEELDNVGNLNNVYDSPPQAEITQDEATTDHIIPITHDTSLISADSDRPVLNDINDSPLQPEISQDEATTDHIAPVVHDTPLISRDNDRPVLNDIHDSPSQPETSPGEPTTDHIASFTHDKSVSPSDNDAPAVADGPNPLEKPDALPTELTILPESISSPPELIASPSIDLHPNAMEPTISPEPVQQTLPPDLPQSLPLPATSNTPLESESTPTEHTSNEASNPVGITEQSADSNRSVGTSTPTPLVNPEVNSNGTSNPVEFPKSEEKATNSTNSNESTTTSNPTPLVKPQIKESAPSTASVESGSRSSSVAITSAPSSPASHFRTASEPRSRNVSSKSDSIRSDAKRSKRHSIFGKVKHLFHLDKDS